MHFIPTGTDFALLFAFLFLFVGSGSLTGSLILKSVPYSPGNPTSPRFSSLEWGLCCLLAGLVVTSFILLLTAQLGIFRIRFWLLLLAAFDVAALLLWLVRFRTSLPAVRSLVGRFELKDLWLFPLLAGAFWMMNRPAEFVATSRDPGEYVNIAVRLADSPSLQIRDPQFQRFDAKEKQALFLREPLEQAPFPEVLPGFYLVDAQKGELLPQFFPLYPLWLALFFKVWRFEGIFLFNALLGTFSVWLVVALAERLLGSRGVGLVAGALLASNPGQVWMSRSPFSELLAQVLLLGGLTLLAVATSTKHRALTLLAGCLFGVSLFVRIDSVLILVGLSVLFFCRTPYLRWLFLPLIGFCVWLALHVWLFAFPYFFHALRTVQNASPSLGITVLLGSASILLGLVAYRRLCLSSARTTARATPLSGGISETGRSLQAAAMLVFGFVVLYGVFIRPHLESAREVVAMPLPHSGTVPLYNEINWVRLSWYLTPVGLALACLGTLLMIRKLATDSAVFGPFLAIFVSFAAFYLYKSQAFPDNYWVIRRYIEIVIPGCLILVSFALQWLSQRSLPGLPPSFGMALSVLLLLVVWTGELHRLSGFFKQRELTGTLRQLEVLAGLNRDADIVLLEQGVFQDFISTPLKFIFQKRVYPLAQAELDGSALGKLVDTWHEQGKRVHLLSSDEQTGVRGRRLEFVPKQRMEFATRIVEPVYDRLPNTMIELKHGVQIYEVETIPLAAPRKVTLNMDFNFGFPTRGFHGVETTADGEAFRWTAGPASLEFPELEAHEAILSLSLAQDFPPEIASQARIRFNGHVVAERELLRCFQVIRSPIPGAWLNVSGKNIISFDSASHSPAKKGLSDDRRQLGLMVDGVKLEAVTPISAAHPFLLDVGSEHDTLDADLSGFFSRDRDSYRWMGAHAEVKLTSPLDTARSLRLVIRAVKSCPDASFRQWISVRVDGRPAGRTELLGTGMDFREYTFTLQPRRNSGQSVIQIAVEPTWNAAKAGTSADSRTLGCAIDWIRIE